VSHHPNIVTLYRPAVTPDGRPVFVLELCRGSLSEQLRRDGPLNAPDVTRVGIKISGALETAHRRGFLHRDMKPQNILVTQFGEPALGDFGVAALQASAQATAGVFGFTTLHAAPEILEGQHLSPATDVYGLASTMYQLLSGQAPFAAFDNEAPASVILRIIRDSVRPLRSDAIPLGLSDLLEAALAKDPARRPQSAASFATALAEVEVASGWPQTTCLVWDRAGHDTHAGLAIPATGTPSRGDPSPLAGPPGADAIAPPEAQRRPDDPSSGQVQPAGPPPAASPAPAGPSITAPQPAGRNVVRPEEARRREERPPRASASPPLAPLTPTGEPSPGSTPWPDLPGRPLYVDPEDRAVAEPDTSLEQTRLPATLGRSLPKAGAAPPQRAPDGSHALLLTAAIGATMAVLMVAVLLITGVL
jgi:Protein kinase domain